MRESVQVSLTAEPRKCTSLVKRISPRLRCKDMHFFLNRQIFIYKNADSKQKTATRSNLEWMVNKTSNSLNRVKNRILTHQERP